MGTLIVGCLWALAACEPDVVRPGPQPPDAPAVAESPEPVDVQVAPGPEGPYHSPWNPQATDSLRVMNNTEGVVTFDVTADVAAAPQGGIYRHGWLLKRVNESTGGALEIGAREGGSAPRLVLTVELPEPVPDVPPDTIPAWLYDHEVSDSPVISGTFLKNILFVIFQEGASQAEKQEAIEAVGGTVVGGIPWFGDRGMYVVLIEDPYPEVPGKGLSEARGTLQGLPQVDRARPEYVFGRMHQHLRPNEGAGWGRADWAVDAADAAAGSARWGLERMATPLAWGCSVGDDSTRIAVVDQGFHAVSDLTPNVAFSLGLGVLPDTLDHGVRMASALGARGNNQDGMTGVMWRAALHLYEVMVDQSGAVTLDPTTGQGPGVPCSPFPTWHAP